MRDGKPGTLGLRWQAPDADLLPGCRHWLCQLHLYIACMGAARCCCYLALVQLVHLLRRVSLYIFTFATYYF